MGTIHLAGSIALFLFGGVILILGFLGWMASSIWGSPIPIITMGIGVVLILLGVLVARLSQK